MGEDARKMGGGGDGVVDDTHLHLDVEHHDLALGALLVDGGLARAVAVAAELGVLDEAVGGDEVLELGHLHVEVVDAVGLAGPRTTRRVRHGQREGVGVRVEQAPDEGALADARGARDDERAAVGRKC